VAGGVICPNNGLRFEVICLSDDNDREDVKYHYSNNMLLATADSIDKCL